MIRTLYCTTVVAAALLAAAGPALAVPADPGEPAVVTAPVAAGTGSASPFLTNNLLVPLALILQSTGSADLAEVIVPRNPCNPICG